MLETRSETSLLSALIQLKKLFSACFMAIMPANYGASAHTHSLILTALALHTMRMKFCICISKNVSVRPHQVGYFV